MDFTKLKPKQILSPPLMVLYGGPGIGKTSFGIGADASNDFKVGLENHLLINIDYRGADRLVCTRASDLLEKPVESTNDLNTIFKNLAEQKHSIEWVVIDDLSSLEEKFVSEVCTENDVSELGKIEYGRGYELAKVKWYHLFEMIKDLQMIKPIGFILIGHTKIDKKKDPMAESYSRHDLQLDNKSKDIVKKAVELIGFAHRKTLTKEIDAKFGNKELVPLGNSTRVITFAPDLESFESKDRFTLPEEIPLDWSIFSSELSKSMSKNNKKSNEKKGE